MAVIAQKDRDFFMNQADTLTTLMQQKKAHQAVQTTATAGAAGRAPRVICITSGKGGVGKTNITANLAYRLARRGSRVLILDADLNLANIDVLLGLTPRYNLQHVLAGQQTLADVLVRGPAGIAILPGSSGILELAELSESQKIYFLEEMESLGADLDFLLVDTAAGINNNVVYFNLAAHERLIVLSPEPTSLTDAYALIKVLSSRYDVKRFRILVNCAVNDREALGVFRKLSMVADRYLDTISLDFLGFLPRDNALPRAVRAQKLACEVYPSSPFAMAIDALAGQLREEPVEIRPDGNIQFFWRGLFSM